MESRGDERVFGALIEEVGVDRLLENLLRTCVEFAAVDRAAVILDEGGLVCRLTLARGEDVKHGSTRLAQMASLPGAMIERAFATRQVIDEQVALAVPIARGDRSSGVLYLEHTGPFTAARVERLRLLCAQVAIALENARLAQDLRERDRYLRIIFRNLPGAVWATDRDLRITYATGRLLDQVGLDPNQTVSLYDAIGTRDPADPAIAHHLGALAGTAQVYASSFRGRWFQTLIEPLVGPDETVIGCVGVAFDITEKHESEERLAEAQRVAHLGTFQWDIKANVITWSDELKRIYGVEAGGFNGTFADFLSRVEPSEVESTRKTILDAYRDRGPFTYDHRIVRSDGQVRALHTQGEVVTDPQGNPIRMVGICWDITDRTAAAAQALRSLSLLRATIEATADGILVIDRDRKVAAYNQRFLAMWTIPAELAERGDDEAMLKWILDQLEHPEEFLRVVNERYASPGLESLDLVHFKDGRVFERYTRPQRIGDEVVGRVWSFRDISERERVLRRTQLLADATRLLASLETEQALESVAHLVVPFLGDRCAIDLFGDGEARFAAGAGPQRPPLHPSVREGQPTRYDLEGALHLGVPVRVRDRLVGAITLAAAGRSYTADDLELVEELARRMAIAIENAELYRGAQEALRARDEFLSIAAHEIRGPINSIHLSIQAMRRGTVEPAKLERLFDLIERQDRRLSRFVDELLDIGHFRAGRLQLNYQAVDLVEVVRAAKARLGPELKHSGSSISVSEPGPVIGEWDKFRLEQLVLNLISNAIKFGLGRPIELVIRSSRDSARLLVRDHGIGIERAARSRIFQAFERGVSVRHYGGLGLGLHIARTIVVALGGELSVESEVGLGSTFTVQLPRSRPGERLDAHADSR